LTRALLARAGPGEKGKKGRKGEGKKKPDLLSVILALLERLLSGAVGINGVAFSNLSSHTLLVGGEKKRRGEKRGGGEGRW